MPYRSQSLEAVEDQVQAELELLAVVVARLQDVLRGELDEVRVPVDGNLGEHRLRHLGGLIGGLERQTLLLQRKAVNVAVQDREGVGGLRHAEPEIGRANV